MESALSESTLPCARRQAQDIKCTRSMTETKTLTGSSMVERNSRCSLLKSGMIRSMRVSLNNRRQRRASNAADERQKGYKESKSTSKDFCAYFFATITGSSSNRPSSKNPVRKLMKIFRVQIASDVCKAQAMLSATEENTLPS